MNLLRIGVSTCFALPASQGCPSDPRSCAGHTMCSNAGARSACSPGDMTSHVAPRGRVRDFSTFESQTMEGDPDKTGLAPLPDIHSCDYGSQCLAVLGRGTFQPMLHCKMTCSRTGQQCSGRYHACCVTQQETQDIFSVLPPNACGVRFGEQDGGSGVHACHCHLWVSPDGRVLFGQATQKGSAECYKIAAGGK